MAIRVRKINGSIIAVCAAETDEKAGDIYLDDNIHYALATKFSNDWNMGYENQELLKLMEGEKVRDAEEDLTEWISAINKYKDG